MEDPGRHRLMVALGELLDHMESADEVACLLVRTHPELEAMATAVRKAAQLVALACQIEAYAEHEEEGD